VPIAPFEVIVVIASSQDSHQVELGEALYRQLQEAAIEVLLDDRPDRAGVKFKDADLIGIPWRVVVGRGASQSLVEVVDRTAGASGGGRLGEMAADAVVPFLLERLQQQRRGLPQEEG
jgi:prolyl-tRNA synthetase